MRDKVILICSECLSRNYVTSINRETETKKEISKFCPKCNKHTLHKISK